jgi:LCP family protein required for cell wall assembly
MLMILESLMFYQQYPDYNSSEHSQNAPDPWSTTQPSVRYNRRPSRRNTPPVWMRRRRRRTGCVPAIALGLILGLILAVYLLAPFRTNVLLLGIDYTDPGSTLGRSDTIILTTFIPLQPYIGMLSIPRDLWINIPGIGENRINTAHFFAESQQPGSGPAAAMQAIQVNFGVGVRYYIRIRFQGFRDVINAMGGVDVDLPEPMAGYPAGRHHLTGNKALAFARQRYGSDDFFRMEHGQLIMKSVFKEMLNPLKWPRLPSMFLAFAQAVDTNIPWWQWPRLAAALLRAGPDGIDNRTITREMVTPFTTSQGASVLLPNWALMNPVLLQMFGQ